MLSLEIERPGGSLSVAFSGDILAKCQSKRPGRQQWQLQQTVVSMQWLQHSSLCCGAAGTKWLYYLGSASGILMTTL
jgi:hypothetical protein